MVIAHHSIFGMYGFWLPNDPRGSGSDYVASWELYRYGTASKTRNRRSVASKEHNSSVRMAAKQALRYPQVVINGPQAVAIVKGFDLAAEEGGYLVHACAVLPDHVHLVIGRHQREIRQIVGHFKARATRQLRLSGLWYAEDRPVWGEHGWNVYLNDDQSVQHAIEYVEENPLKKGKRPQRWSFVKKFNPSIALALKRTESASQATRRNKHEKI